MQCTVPRVMIMYLVGQEKVENMDEHVFWLEYAILKAVELFCTMR